MAANPSARSPPSRQAAVNLPSFGPVRGNQSVAAAFANLHPPQQSDVAGGIAFAEQTYDHRPGFPGGSTVSLAQRTTLHRLLLRPGMFVSSVRIGIASPLPADRRSSPVQIAGNLRLAVSGLSHRLNRMALFRRQLPVGFFIHTGSFGLAGANLQAVGAALAFVPALHFTRQCAHANLL